jgi:hypothetical protein
MKKSMLYTGIGYMLFGLMSIAIALIFEFKFESFLWGLGGAGMGPGIMMVWKYMHWSKPENRDEYNERLRIEKIEMADERKVMLRDKSGRITYLIMLGVYCVLLMIFSFLVTIEWFMPFAKYIVIVLSMLLIFQFACGIIVFNYLNK